MSLRGLAQGAAIMSLLLQSAFAAPVISNNFDCFESVEAILEKFELTAAQQVLEQTDFLRLFKLSPDRPITLFLPEDAALAPVLDSQGGVIGLGSNLVQVLMLNHISFDAGHFSFTLDVGDTIQTGLGLADIQCPFDDGQLTWTGEGLEGLASSAKVVEKDLVPCDTKLVIHVIDDVLIPNCEIGRGISLIELLTGEALTPTQVDDIQAAFTPASDLPPLPDFEPGPAPAPQTLAGPRALEPSLPPTVEPAAEPALDEVENIAPGPTPILSVEPTPALGPEPEPTALAPTAVEPTVEPALGPEAAEPIKVITPEEGLAPEDMAGPASGLSEGPEIEPEELFPALPPSPADGDRGLDEFEGPTPTPSEEPDVAEVPEVPAPVPEPEFAPPPLEEDFDDIQCEETVLEMLENFEDTDLLIDYFRENFASELNDPDKSVTVFLPLNDTTLDYVSRRMNTSNEDGFMGLNSTYQQALASVHIIPNITANSSEFRTGQTIRDTLLKDTGIDQCSGSLDITLREETSSGVIARTSTQVYITASGELDRDIWVAHTNLFTCSGNGVIHVLRYPLIPKCRGLDLGPQKDQPQVTGQLDASLVPPPEEDPFFNEDTSSAGLGGGVSVVVAMLAARLSLNWLTW